eukprot:UN26587
MLTTAFLRNTFKRKIRFALCNSSRFSFSLQCPCLRNVYNPSFKIERKHQNEVAFCGFQTMSKITTNL